MQIFDEIHQVEDHKIFDISNTYKRSYLDIDDFQCLINNLIDINIEIQRFLDKNANFSYEEIAIDQRKMEIILYYSRNENAEERKTRLKREKDKKDHDLFIKMKTAIKDHCNEYNSIHGNDSLNSFLKEIIDEIGQS